MTLSITSEISSRTFHKLATFLENKRIEKWRDYGWNLSMRLSHGHQRRCVEIARCNTFNYKI